MVKIVSIPITFPCQIAGRKFKKPKFLADSLSERGSDLATPGHNGVRWRRDQRNHEMSKTEVFQFEAWDQAAGATKTAAHMATREFIQMAKGAIIEGSGREIDSSLIDGNGKADISVQPDRTHAPRSPRPVRIDLNPFPETAEATAKGCICKIARDSNGNLLRTQDGGLLYAMEKACPIHEGRSGLV
jgi:hypothetical protein